MTAPAQFFHRPAVALVSLALLAPMLSGCPKKEPEPEAKEEKKADPEPAPEVTETATTAATSTVAP